MREFGEVGEDRGRIGAGVVLGAKLVQRGGRVTLHQMLEQVDDAAAIAEAQHLADRIGGDRAAAMGDRLVEYRQAIAGRAFGGTRDHGERGVVDLDRFQSRDPGEMGDQQLGVDAPEVEALAARQHGDRHLADLGGGEDELHMRRRLLERLQKAVEGLRRQHVHFVDDVDLVARRHRRVAHLLDDLADVVDAGVRGGVHLDHVDMAAFHDGGAVLADFVELDRRLVDGGGLVVQRTGEDARRRRLADAAHAGQHPCLGDAAGGESVGQGADHRLLADETAEIGRAIFARQHAVAAVRLLAQIDPGFAHPPVLLRSASAGRQSLRDRVSPAAREAVNGAA